MSSLIWHFISRFMKDTSTGDGEACFAFLAALRRVGTRAR